MSLNFIDTPKCRGEFHVEVRRNGKIIDEYADHNLVVDGGRVRLAELAAGLSQKHITQIGIGEGLAPEDETDTELRTSYAEKIGFGSFGCVMVCRSASLVYFAPTTPCFLIACG